jgi:hypothetical protein
MDGRILDTRKVYQISFSDELDKSNQLDIPKCVAGFCDVLCCYMHEFQLSNVKSFFNITINLLTFNFGGLNVKLTKKIGYWLNF